MVCHQKEDEGFDSGLTASGRTIEITDCASAVASGLNENLFSAWHPHLDYFCFSERGSSLDARQVSTQKFGISI